ncbi:preprotein translocase subunit YajC [Rhizorhapis suberifaciens]|uniref:Sec translocon accessory complex subunit YajC n=1 Tax=Rhizorhapis suberifaciens TaxID=13656 RepID=A0A840HXX6_9SPHN|nr:preprotein translocase subunit YajC [Rhizorhapis suberifaciens]MBB4642410.1 preprotein translocase subunit YajC [Rhizorhapis suberifaciens]
MFISTALAQTSGAAAPGGTSFLVQLLPLVLIFAVFYFLLIRPQQKKMKDHRAVIDAVKKGDQVITAGGMVGKVLRVDESYVDVEIAQGVKVKVVKSTLSDVVQPGNVKPAND